jgi:16S rRNA (guanine527-N7)-methyltransferase
MIHKDINLWIKEIKSYNELLNLVSKTMVHDIEKHIDNTMDLLEHVQEPYIADLGSGSGLPAIPFKIMYPDSCVVMIERSQKKCVFLRHVIDVLNLKNIDLLEVDPLTAQIGPFDAVMSRAFSPRKNLENLVLKILKPHGRFYYFSTSGQTLFKNNAFSLTGHEDRQFKGYTLSLDIYEVTSQL